MHRLLTDRAVPFYSGAVATTFAIHILVPLLPMLHDELQLSYPMLGVLSSTASVFMLVADLASGFALRRFRLKYLFMLALTVSTLGSLVGFRASTLSLLLLARASAGFGFSLMLTLGVVGVGRRAERAQSTVRLAGLDASGMLGRSLAPMVSGLVAVKFGWRASFATAAALVSTVLLLSGLYMDSSLKLVSDPGEISQVRAMNKASSDAPRTDNEPRPALACLLAYLYSVLIFTRVGAIAFLVPLLGRDILSCDVAVLGLLLGISSLLMIAVIIPGAAFARVAGERTVLLFGLVTTALALVLLGNVFSRTAFLLGLFLLPLNATSVSLTWAVFVRLIDRWQRPEMLGLFRLAGDGGAVLGPLLLGLMTKNSLSLAFTANAVLLLPAIAIASWKRLTS